MFPINKFADISVVPDEVLENLEGIDYLMSQEPDCKKIFRYLIKRNRIGRYLEVSELGKKIITEQPDVLLDCLIYAISHNKVFSIMNTKITDELSKRLGMLDYQMVIELGPYCRNSTVFSNDSKMIVLTKEDPELLEIQKKLLDHWYRNVVLEGGTVEKQYKKYVEGMYRIKINKFADFAVRHPGTCSVCEGYSYNSDYDAPYTVGKVLNENGSKHVEIIFRGHCTGVDFDLRKAILEKNGTVDDILLEA